MSGYSLTVERQLPYTWFDCKGERADVAERCKELGMRLPEERGRFSAVDELTLFEVTPRHWLLRAPLSDEQALLDWASAAETDARLSIVWVADHHCGFELRGEEVREVLAQASPLDTNTAAFTPGSACFTEVFATRGLVCYEREPSCYSLYVERSYADYVEAWLAAASGRDSEDDHVA